MSLSNMAMVTLVQAKAHLRVDTASSLRIDAEYVGVGDGADKTFDLDNTPVEGSLQLYVNNALQIEVTDYTISGATITFVTAPASPKPITATYDKAASVDTFESYDDGLLEDLIEAATRKAEEYAGRAFIQRSITESHFGDGTKVLKLYKQPVESITSVVREISEEVGIGVDSVVNFTLAETPTNDASVKLYVDGVLQTLTTDYTLDGAAITFVVAPADDIKITAKYTHTILAINEYTEWLSIGRLKCEDLWTTNRIFTIVYTAGYASTRAATQVLVPSAVSAVLLILANLYENRVDQLKSENISGVGSVTYDIPSQAKVLLNPYRTNLL